MEPGPDAIRSITHDMRNLLTAVRGHAELALRGLPADDPIREDVAHCVVVTSAVFDLIDQLDGSDTSATLVAVNLDRSIAAMRRLLDALLPDSIEMELATHSDGARVSISKLRVERIVLNLALNARDAMADGGKLALRTRPGPDGTAQIVVSDTGPGFSEEALGHLFEDGFTTKGERGGSGSGLSALKRFVDGAGGSIDVDSAAGEGATVIVTLPTADPDAAMRRDGTADDAGDGDATADEADAEPNATDAEPNATDAEPNATDAEPDATDAEPDATDAEPDATDAKQS